jgi:hypothetical protein
MFYFQTTQILLQLREQNIRFLPTPSPCPPSPAPLPDKRKKKNCIVLSRL